MGGPLLATRRLSSKTTLDLAQGDNKVKPLKYVVVLKFFKYY